MYNGTCKQKCLNCGTELIGEYCHECGQQRKRGDSSVWGFVLEYLNNAYMWDPQIMVTCWQLFTKPGYLTKRFLSGKYIAHSHPLKLNMFLLFVFITLYLLFKQDDPAKKSAYFMTKDEQNFAALQMAFLVNDEAYLEKIKSSERDTVLFHAPVELFQYYGEYITQVEVYDDTNWKAVIPKVLIEDNILTCNEDNYYHFNKEADTDILSFRIINDIGSKMSDIISNYTLVIILLSIPLLTASIALINRRRKEPLINHLIFSLHYTAFLELLIIIIYLIFLAVHPPLKVLEWILALGANVYLIIAFKNIYDTSSWIRCAAKSLIANTVYLMICAVFAVIIFIIACIYALF